MCGIKRQYFRIQYVKRSGSTGHKYKMFPVFVLNIVIGAATQKLVYEFKHIERSRLICRIGNKRVYLVNYYRVEQLP